MGYDDDWPDMTWENRRLMLKKTIRPVSIAELQTLGEARFPIVTDPWCIRYFEFLKNHPDDSFYRGDIPGDVEIIYSREGEKAVWFLPGKGMGIVQAKGLQMLREIVDGL